MDEKIRKCFTEMGEFDPEFQLFDIEETIGNLKALIASYSREARIDEISGVQLEYGHYVAQTFVNGKAMSILDRIAELKALGGKEANHE